MIFGQVERDRVDAIAQTGGGWAVRKNVSQVGVTTGAEDLGAAHEEAIVLFRFNAITGDRLPKARPTRPRVEFRLGGKKVVAAARAAISPLLLGVPVFSAKSAFGSLLSTNVKPLGGQLRPPLGVGLLDLVHYRQKRRQVANASMSFEYRPNRAAPLH